MPEWIAILNPDNKIKKSYHSHVKPIYFIGENELEKNKSERILLMAQQARKRRQKDRAREAFMLLMLSVVLVFGFSLIIGKQESQNFEQAEAVPVAEAVSQEEPPAEEVNPAPAVTETVQDDTPVQLHPATNFWSVQPHIYIRVSHQKQLEIQCNPNVSLSEALFSVTDTNIAMIDEFGMITGVSKGECSVHIIAGDEELEIPVTVREMKVENGCTYVDDVLIANKQISLPADYNPGMLPETAQAFEELQAAAAAEGLNIYDGSDYRSYQFQITVYNSLVETYGKEYADRISAKPGHSEHQTGYTVDCNTINQDFINTPEGQWLDQHCHEFGFIIRYPEGKEAITGYAYECWHIRYVGIPMAAEIYEQGLTLEEYLDIVDVETHYNEENDISSANPAESAEEIQENEEDVPEETPYQETPEDDIQIMDAPLEAP